MNLVLHQCCSRNRGHYERSSLNHRLVRCAYSQRHFHLLCNSFWFVDIDCKIAAVLSRDEYKVVTLLATAVRESGGSAAAVLLQQPLQITHTASGQHNWPHTRSSDKPVNTWPKLGLDGWEMRFEISLFSTRSVSAPGPSSYIMGTGGSFTESKVAGTRCSQITSM
jgi:hypothetical protein